MTEKQRQRREELKYKLTKKKLSRIVHVPNGAKTLCGWGIELNVIVGKNVTCKRCLFKEKPRLVHADSRDLLGKLTLCGWNRTYTNLVIGKNVTCKRCLEVLDKNKIKIVHLSGGEYTMCGKKSVCVVTTNLLMYTNCKVCLNR